MDEQRATVTLSALARWLVAAGLIAVGLGLYFRFAPDTQPVAPPSVEEARR